MPNVSRLVHTDFIRANPFREILTPHYIPVHPKVFDSELTYSPDFFKEVLLALPGYADADMSAISRVLEMDMAPYIPVMESRYRMLEYWANPQKRSLDVFLGSANIALDAKQKGLHRKVYPDHPMPLQKLQEYRIPGDEEPAILTWYTHNVSDFGLAAEVIFRNVAIAVNNMALDRLEL